MDRRSWLWRRKSSEKIPGGGETESSGSLSSHSERFSDDQVCSNHNTQSPEVTSKASPSYKELDESVKSLTEKLSAALLNIKVKEDLVKQHEKVAEEAISGWEKAESEAVVFKQQLEDATKRNSALEDRILHLNGALKECVRQLRLVREEHDQKLNDVIAKKTHEWESTKSEQESQASTKSEQESQAFTSKLMATEKKLMATEKRLEAAEKENSVLKLELLSRDEEIEIRIIERDLSTQAAEMASKQHLESIKKVARLEAECRRLKAMARKPSNDNKSVTASSIYVESFTDSQSDSGERLLLLESDNHKMDGSEPNECMKALGRNLMVPSVDILMEDFLEMERIAALPHIGNGPLSDQPHEEESPLKADLEVMIYRTAELEEKLEKVEMEKVELEMDLSVCRDQVKKSNDRRIEVEAKLVELRTQLSRERDARLASEAKIEATSARREWTESQLGETEAEMKTLLSKVGYLEEEVEKERALSGEAVVQCRKMEDEILRMKHEVELLNSARLNGDLKLKKEKELSVAAGKLSECQKTIASLGKQLKSLATLEDFRIDSEENIGAA
ncbi:filament-like plant protein 3 isoform X1 [Rhododendron vialii]|uniref:filament-like plant protein 3 isoform X1 n=1 Tax=Rhododendron vialii TaxID=182163 RepID=UPI00265E19B9|nr:filament-like plant protein 3 isoform X1 [Rhododendron vialii]XP_058186519.1 filament-like plant protein 3 isoform X1 [Rhododendron vialii]